MNYIRIFMVIIVNCFLLLISINGYSQDQVSEQLVEINPAELPQRLDSNGTGARIQQARLQLQQLQNTILGKRELLAQMQAQLLTETDSIELQDLQTRITQEETDINNLRISFESIALGGIDLRIFNTEQQNIQFDWQQELQSILKPLFQKLKDLTEKPRQMERLNTQLALLDSQRRTALRALASIEQVLDEDIDEVTRLRLDTLHQTWERQLNDIQQRYDINQLQLNRLTDEDESVVEQVRRSMKEFFTGSGLHLGLSIGAFFLTMFLMRGLYLLYHRLNRNRAIRATTASRMLAYGYQTVTALMSIVAAVLVLYMVGDMLLLVLALILIVFMILGLRNYLPRFIDEMKLLLNIGSVRVHERVNYNGLPWMVRSLGVYTHLYNPALEGLMRLPLQVVLGLVSRPYREDEPWFPTRTGDWVMMSDDSVGQILRQTPEFVQVKTRGAIRNYITTNFIANEPRNLSDGFGVMVSFGLDYELQAISTTEVPGILQQSVEQALKDSELGQHVEKILVEFMEAGASSLNYLVHVSMKGAAADSYFALQRLLQQTCVNTCNAHGWVIPFNQLTVHAGSGFVAGKS